MIKIVCECGNTVDSTDDKSRAEINLADRMFYFKCPECKKSIKFKLNLEYVPLPRIGRT